MVSERGCECSVRVHAGVTVREAGLATHYVPSSALPQLEEALQGLGPQDASQLDRVAALLDQVQASHGPLPTGARTLGERSAAHCSGARECSLHTQVARGTATWLRAPVWRLAGELGTLLPLVDRYFSLGDVPAIVQALSGAQQRLEGRATVVGGEAHLTAVDRAELEFVRSSLAALRKCVLAPPWCCCCAVRALPRVPRHAWVGVLRLFLAAGARRCPRC